MTKRYPRYLIFLSLVVSVTILACAQSQSQKQTKPATNGQTATELPQPYDTPSANNGPRVVPRPEGAQLRVPAGFKVEEFASDFKTPRWMVQGPNGDIFVSEVGANRVTILRGMKDGKPESRFEFATGLNLPFGMAFHNDFFYVANTDSVVRYHYRIGQTAAEGSAEKIIDLPGHGYNQHW